jgi:hypothetical protein
LRRGILNMLTILQSFVFFPAKSHLRAFKFKPETLVIIILLAIGSQRKSAAIDSTFVCADFQITSVINILPDNIYPTWITVPAPEMNSLPQTTPQTSVFRRRRTMRRQQQLGLGGNIFGPTLSVASAYMQYSFIRTAQIEVGLDLSTVYGGFNFYPRVITQNENLSPYMGLMIGYSMGRNKQVEGIYAYMPVGIRYVTPDDLYICLEIAATTAHNVRSAPLFLGLKMGFLIKKN